MKKFISLLLAVTLMLLMVSCTSEKENETAGNSEKTTGLSEENTTESTEINTEKEDVFLTLTVELQVIDDRNNEWKDIGTKEITLEIPRFDDLDFIGMKGQNSALSDESKCIYGNDGTFISLGYGVPYSVNEVYIGINYKNDEYTVENITCGVIEGFEDEVGKGKEYELFFGPKGEILSYIEEDEYLDENQAVENSGYTKGYTYTGFEFRSGEFYDNNGTKITEDEFYNELRSIREQYDHYMYW